MPSVIRQTGNFPGRPQIAHAGVAQYARSHVYAPLSLPPGFCPSHTSILVTPLSSLHPLSCQRLCPINEKEQRI